jgi:hypothetical protein
MVERVVVDINHRHPGPGLDDDRRRRSQLIQGHDSVGPNVCESLLRSIEHEQHLVLEPADQQ